MNNSTNFSFGEFDFCEDLLAISTELRGNVPYYVAVVLIFTLGFIGNIVTVCVISCWSKLHTPTFTMIACLAASDAYSLMSYMLQQYTNLLQITFCTLRKNGHAVAFVYCWFTLFYLGRLNAGMQLCVLACLRFTAIVYPLKFKTYCTCKAVIVMSIGGSIIILFISVAFIVLNWALFDINVSNYAVNTVIFALNFIVPSSIFTVLHCLKLRALRRSPALNSNSSLKMNVVVSIMLSIYVISSASMMMHYILVLQYGIHVLSFVARLSFVISCAINPFIYFFSSPPIVQLFRKIWHRLCQKCQDANNGNTQGIEMNNASTTWDWISERTCKNWRFPTFACVDAKNSLPEIS